MPFKNYYTVLGTPHTATSEEIRLAFRTLAKKFHPDKAQDNPFAEAHFKEIQEAYETLSNPTRRIAYDEERWLLGLTTRSKSGVSITPEWILAEAKRLRKHMSVVDTYHMNHAALRDYVIALLSPAHLSVLREAGGYNAEILEEIFASIDKLHHSHTSAITVQLSQLAGVDPEMNLRVLRWKDARMREAKWNTYRPWIVLAATLLLCAIIWLLKERQG